MDELHTVPHDNQIVDETDTGGDYVLPVPQPLTPIYDEDGFALDHGTLRRRPTTRDEELPWH